MRTLVNLCKLRQVVMDLFMYTQCTSRALYRENVTTSFASDVDAFTFNSSKYRIPKPAIARGFEFHLHLSESFACSLRLTHEPSIQGRNFPLSMASCPRGQSAHFLYWRKCIRSQPSYQVFMVRPVATSTFNPRDRLLWLVPRCHQIPSPYPCCHGLGLAYNCRCTSSAGSKAPQSRQQQSICCQVILGILG